MLTKVERGETSGAKYEQALGELAASGSVQHIPPRAGVSEQMTPAGRYLRVGRDGMGGLLRGLNRDATNPHRRSALTLHYTDRQGRPRTHTIYSKGGRHPAAIADDLEARGAEPDSPDSVRLAIDALIADASSSPDEGSGGGTHAPDVRRITGVEVTPA